MIGVALVSLATALVLICCIGTIGCAWTWRRHLARGRCCASRRVGQRLEARLEKPKETRLQALQRRFVSGEITLDEYERDLDRLHRHASLA